MSFKTNLIVLLLCAGNALAETPLSGLEEIQDLGRINGEALACSQMGVSNQAKAMMIRHAPKTRSYGEVFESATSTAFLAQGEASLACPKEVEFSARLYAVGNRLQRVLPAAR
ncbi:MAG: hypothetical protein D3M94_18600 [Rhodocyclales bacterium GT-UBC]|nr:MAG: hypothetical protein D3M94_18600 [Rhodocyclales bacterium GT-UBC]